MADDVKFVISIDDEDVVRTLNNHKRLEKELISLKKQYDQIQLAQKQGKLSTTDYAKGLDQVNRRISHLNGVMNGGAKAINKHAEYVVQAKNKMSRFGMVSQQVGYQVGDFFVQVQSGQNKMVAFTQQATQLAGLLPGLGGAVVGISLSLVGMAYQMNKATSSTASLAKNVEELSKLLKDFQDASKAIGDASDNFGVFADYTKDALTNLREISRIKLDESIKGILGGDIKRGKALVGGKIQEVMTSYQAMEIRDFLGGDTRSAPQAKREVSQFATARSAFAGAEGTQQQLVAAQKLSDVFVSIVGEYGNMNEEQKSFYASLQNVIIEIAKLGKSIPNPQKAYVESLTAALKLQTAQDNYNRSVEQAVKLYGRVRQQAKDLADKEQEAYNNKLKIGLALYTNLRLQAKELADKDQESSNNKIQTGISLYVGLRQQAKDLADKEQ